MISLQSGYPHLKEELQQNRSTAQIKTLCVREESGNIQVTCFHLAGSLSLFAQNFHTMTLVHVSDLFHWIWTAQLDAAVSADPNLAIEDIYPKVWTPTFECCHGILKQLQDQSIKLADVDRYFKHYEGQQQQLEFQLFSLFKGVNECLDQTGSDAWIKQVIQCMNKYWNLCQCQEAAIVIRELQRTLNLKGDFGDIEILSRKV